MSTFARLAFAIVVTLSLLPGCGGESSEGESDAAEATVSGTPEQELILAMDRAIALVQSDSIRGLFEEFTPPEDLARIDSSGQFNQVASRFNIFKLDFVRALQEAKGIPPEFNEDTTKATYEVVDVLVPGGKVKFRKIGEKWYFSD